MRHLFLVTVLLVSCGLNPEDRTAAHLKDRVNNRVFSATVSRSLGGVIIGSYDSCQILPTAVSRKMKSDAENLAHLECLLQYDRCTFATQTTLIGETQGSSCTARALIRGIGEPKNAMNLFFSSKKINSGAAISIGAKHTFEACSQMNHSYLRRSRDEVLGEASYKCFGAGFESCESVMEFTLTHDDAFNCTVVVAVVGT